MDHPSRCMAPAQRTMVQGCFTQSLTLRRWAVGPSLGRAAITETEWVRWGKLCEIENGDLLLIWLA